MATALDVRNGSIIIEHGFRCVASDVEHVVMHGSTTARYTLHSAPNDIFPTRMPAAYEGMRSGGNHLARVFIESQPVQNVEVQS